MAKANGPAAPSRCGWPVFTGAPGRAVDPGQVELGVAGNCNAGSSDEKWQPCMAKCMAMPAEMAQNLVSTSSSSNFGGLIYTIHLLVMLGMAYGISCATFGGIGKT